MSEAETTRVLTLLSVVSPVYNEAETLHAFHSRVSEALAGIPFELVWVDDGSTDGSDAIMAELSAADHRVKAILLSRNFGQPAAATAGLDHAAGDAVVMIDGDLQDPPELIPRMLDEWRRGVDVVYAVRVSRAGESAFKIRTANWFYRLFAGLTRIGVEQNAGDYRLLSRRALDALLQMRERNRYLRGMTFWVGFTQTAVPYERDRRYDGETKYNARKLIRVALDAVSSFSNVPLQLSTVLGFLVSAFAFLAIPVVLGLRLAGHYIPGFSTLLIVVLMLGGIQLIAIGLIGEYLGRVYDEVKQRPLYVVRAVRTAEAPAPPPERELERSA
jgi:polyisoprenyl-phosphate glycosyltransferase